MTVWLKYGWNFTFLGGWKAGGGVRGGGRDKFCRLPPIWRGSNCRAAPVCTLSLLDYSAPKGFLHGYSRFAFSSKTTFDFIWLQLFQFDLHWIVYLTRRIICARSSLTRVNKFIINYYYDTFFRHGNRWYTFCRQLYRKREPNYIELVSFQLLLDCQPRSLRYFHTVGWFTMTTGTSIDDIALAANGQIWSN